MKKNFFRNSMFGFILAFIGVLPVSGLWINRSVNSVGLFGTIAGGAVIKNVGVKVADSKSVIGNETVKFVK